MEKNENQRGNIKWKKDKFLFTNWLFFYKSKN